MDIYVWVYKSREVPPLSEDDIARILNVSRLYNREHDITGILLYNEGRFTQVIEGSRDNILILKARIMADSRHKDIITLYEGHGQNRIFSSWSMAFHTPDELQMKQLDSFMPIDWGQRTVETVNIKGRISKALRLMSEWVSSPAQA